MKNTAINNPYPTFGWEVASPPSIGSDAGSPTTSVLLEEMCDFANAETITLGMPNNTFFKLEYNQDAVSIGITSGNTELTIGPTTTYKSDKLKIIVNLNAVMPLKVSLHLRPDGYPMALNLIANENNFDFGTYNGDAWGIFSRYIPKEALKVGENIIDITVSSSLGAAIISAVALQKPAAPSHIKYKAKYYWYQAWSTQIGYHKEPVSSTFNYQTGFVNSKSAIKKFASELGITYNSATILEDLSNALNLIFKNNNSIQLTSSEVQGKQTVQMTNDNKTIPMFYQGWQLFFEFSVNGHSVVQMMDTPLTIIHGLDPDPGT